MSPWRVFIRSFVSHKLLFLIFLITSLVVAGCEIGIPWLLKDIVDIAISQKNLTNIHQIGVLILLVVVILYFSHLILLRIEITLLQKGMFELRKILYSRVLQQSPSFFNTIKTGALMSHVQQDTATFEDHAIFLISDLPFDLFTVLGICIFMLILNPSLMILVLCFLSISMIITSYIGRPLVSLSKIALKTRAEFSSKLNELFNGIRTLKSFGQESNEIEKLSQINKKMVDAELKTGALEGFIIPYFDLVNLLGVILVIWYGAHLIIAKQILPGGLVAFLMYMEILAGPFSRAGKYYEHWRKCRGVSQRISNFSDQLNTTSAYFKERIAPTHTNEFQVSFENVGFKYNVADRFALSHINFTLKPGEITALVGRNGSGKSTIVDLLLGFQCPKEGDILLGKNSIFDLKESDWRKKIGVFPQEVFLFHDTLANNIAYGKPSAFEKEIEEAARQSGLSEVITRLNQGIHASIGEKGRNLSGGERQKIALARLLLQDPDIIIFDEASTHLDAETLAKFITILNHLAKNKTILLVEHRKALIQLATKIIVLDGGEIVAIGTHQELIKSQPIYQTVIHTK